MITKSTLYIGIIALFFVACEKNKEQTDYEKLAHSEPVISGVENSETPDMPETTIDENINEEGIAVITENDSIADVSTAFAINDQGYYKYKLKLEKGKIYKLNTTNKSTTVQKLTMGQTQSATENVTLVEKVDFKVLQVLNNTYKMQATFTDSKFTYSGNQINKTITPKSKEPENPLFYQSWLTQKYKNGKTITFHLSEFGEVSNIIGFNSILSGINKELDKKLSGEELQDAKAYFKQQLSPEGFKYSIEESLIKFPKKGLKVGDTYTQNSPRTKGAKTNITLTKVEDGKAYISIKSTMPQQSDSQTENGVVMKMTANRSNKGTVVLDTQSGWINTATITDVSTNKGTQSYQGQTMSSTQNTTTVTSINK